jgi:hypothetical protein
VPRDCPGSGVPVTQAAIHSTLDVPLRRVRFVGTELSTMPLGLLHGELQIYAVLLNSRWRE